MKYTNLSDEIVFLKDSDIVQDFDEKAVSGTIVETNGIPSYSFYKQTYDKLSTYDDNLSTRMSANEAIAAFISSTINSISDGISADVIKLSTETKECSALLSGVCVSLSSTASGYYGEFISTSKELSDHIVSVETSAYTISSDVDCRLLELSNTLSTYADSISSSLSATCDSNRDKDKAELSNTLSTYADSIVSSLSGSLSASVNGQFVHLSGDTVNGSIAIKEHLSVAENLVIDGATRLGGKLTQGKDTIVKSDINGIALGVKSIAKKNYSFVWNGNEGIDIDYTDQGTDTNGTFNINPKDGVNGVYVGTQTLSAIIHDDVQTSADSILDTLTTTADDILSAVDAKRSSDKKELSNVLSSYSNSISASLSATIEANRNVDLLSAKTETTNQVSVLSTSLSNFIDAAHYSVIEKIGFDYIRDKHAIVLSACDQLGTSCSLSIDSADFIKARIVDHVEIKEVEGKKILRIWWTPESESGTGIYTDVPLAELTKIYKGGTGISIDNDLTISVSDYDVIKNSISANTENVKVLSNATVPAIDDRVKSAEDYIKELSAPYSKGGLIKTLSINLSSHIDNTAKNVKALSTSIDATNTSVDTLDVKIGRLQAYANRLSGTGEYIGDISVLSGNIDDIKEDIHGIIEYAGKINFDKYDPDWIRDGGNNHLSSLLKHAVTLGTDNTIRCGSVYKVTFDERTKDDKKFTFSNPLFAADQYWDTDDGVRLAHNCYLIVRSHDPKASEIRVDDVTSADVAIMDGEWYKTYQDQVLDNIEEIWRSGNNKLTSAVEVSVYTTTDNKPAISVVTGHAISGNNDIGGNNHFLDGNNLFDGFNIIEKLSSSALSADDISADDIIAANLTANNEVVVKNRLSVEAVVELLSSNVTVKDEKVTSNYKVDINNRLFVADSAEISGTLSIDNNLSVANVLTATKSSKTLVAENLSSGALSVDWTKAVHPNGYSLFDLSVDLSNKIYIEDRVDETISGTTDLSIIKLGKDEFDEGVALGTMPLSGNIMYIVDSDYIDAYGEQLCNLTMPEDSVPTVATNKHYVDSLSASLSNTVKLSVENLQSQVINNDNDISYISAEVSANDNDISYLSGQISASETDVSAIFHQLYGTISSITNSSTLPDLITAVIATQHILSVFA